MISPTEDLMREHGLLSRILGIYDDVRDRIRTDDVDSLLPSFGLAHSAALIVRTVIEDHHEQEEEREVFPRLGAVPTVAPIVKILEEQHRRGRMLTDAILSVSAARNPSTFDAQVLSEAMWKFAFMYRPHAAWEDTVVFPALHRVVTESDLARMAHRFERAEHKAFGEHAFARIVGEVAEIEESLVIGLARYG